MSKIRIRSLVTMMILSIAYASAQGIARQFVIPLHQEKDTAALYVFLPRQQNASGRVVLACPGGAYSHLSMENEGTDWADFFCQQGIALVVLKYRMPKGDRRIPIADAENAIRLIRDSAEVWQLNPFDVGIMGFSAGGHLASTVSTHAEFQARPNFSILFYPVITMMKKGQHENSCKAFLGADRDSDVIARSFSNEYQVRRHITPPSIIIMANDDRGVPPVTNGLAYYTAMRNAGNECAVHIYPHGGHGFGFRKSFEAHDEMTHDLTAWLENLKSPRKDAIRVACIGNSITDGQGIDMADDFAYPAQLQRLLGDDYHVKNYGVGVRTLLNQGDRPYMRELAWRDALAFLPHVVIIKLGTNDSKTENWKHKGNFASDYQQMIDSLRALPSNPRIILAYPIKAFKDQWTISDKVIVEEVIPEIDAVARKNSLEVIDLHSVITDSEMVVSDGIHPNARGAELIAKSVAEMVRKQPPITKKIKSGKK